MQLPRDAQPQSSALPQSWRDAAFREPNAVLLETSLPNEAERASYLFTNALEVLTAQRPDDLPRLFAAIERSIAAGRYAAGWFAYEAGAHFLGTTERAVDGPVAVLGVYDSPRIFDHFSDTNDFSGSVESQTLIAKNTLPIAPMMRMPHSDYVDAVEQVQRWIADGETYQVNLTSGMVTPCSITAAEVYESLREQQPCGYGAVIRLQPLQTILSFSPELFFRVAADCTITTRPMKGTIKRGTTPEEDVQQAELLRNDEKNRAEHVMIVDLLRNDLGRICTTGSVRVDELFAVEQYASLLQMTSTIRGALPHGLPWYEVFRALFPCGSITGAPKRHTVNLINQLETEPRGIYTGAIGYFAPDRTACFNVAIRTAVLENEQLTLGVGGGIVADSIAQDEYAECLLKAAFLQRASQPLRLIETMRWHDGQFPLLDRHLQRLKQSSEALGIPLDTSQVTALLHNSSTQWDTAPRRVRLTVDQLGKSAIGFADAPAWRGGLRLDLATHRINSSAPHLRHKTTFRPEYDDALKAATAEGFDEAIFRNERDELTEGCISSLLVCVDGRWYTPPLAAGVLPGIYRGLLLDRSLIHERPITLTDLADAEHVAVCNAVRGVGAVASLHLPDGRSFHWPSLIDTDAMAAW